MATFTLRTTGRAKVLPHTKPPFTLGDLKKAIPPHCFKRPLLKSFLYVAYDLAIICFFYHVASNYFHLLPHSLSYIAWPVYWCCQSFVLSSIWVLAHECGHHAFSDYAWLDNTLGMIIHTSLYIPYFSWRISHRKHHSNIGSMEYEESYAPKLKDQIYAFYKYIENPIRRVIMMVFLCLFGWHGYLHFNFYGRNYNRFTSHFDPYSPIFSDNERHLVWISNAGILAFTYVLYNLAMVKGFPWLLCHYVAPYVMHTFSLVVVTFLQHTHPALPHYDSTEWYWLRGALSTIDRDFGIFNKIWHNANDTHVLHHLFSTIPHYHAKEATEAIKPILGEYYNFDGTPIWKALWRDFKECIYVEQDQTTTTNGIYWFKTQL